MLHVLKAIYIPEIERAEISNEEFPLQATIIFSHCGAILFKISLPTNPLPPKMVTVGFTPLTDE